MRITAQLVVSRLTFDLTDLPSASPVRGRVRRLGNRVKENTLICKACIHYHDDILELPWFKRPFAVRTMFSETCDLTKFADPVDGARMPCVTARVSKCQGEKPNFAPRSKTPNVELGGAREVRAQVFE